MLTIGIYPRKSVYRDNSESIQVQIKLCREYAAVMYKDEDEISLVIYDKDEGFSGKNTNRPSFQEMMRDVRMGKLDVVMVYRLDRIARNMQEFSEMYGVFQQHGVSFVSIKESFDTATPIGRTIMYILAAFSQLERENTSERVADNMLALGAAGKWTGGTLPAGMTSTRMQVGDKEHSYLIVDQDTIWRPKLLYRLMLEGYTITKVERYCRDHGIKTTTGKFLSTSQIHGILSNPVYCQNDIEAYYYFRDMGCTLPDSSLFDGTKGLIGYGKTKTGKVSQKKQNKSDWTISIGIHEPVVSSSDWIAVQKRLNINTMVRTPKHNAGILRGVLRCSCGAKMDIRTYQKNNIWFSYYYCSAMSRQGRQYCNSKYTRIEKIDDCFIKKLQELKLDPEEISTGDSRNAFFQSSKSIKDDIKKLQTSLDNLAASLAQAAGSSASGYIINQIENLDAQKQSLEKDLRDALLAESQTQTEKERQQELYENVCYLLDNFNSIDYPAKNELIRKIVKMCTYDGQKLRIIF